MERVKSKPCLKCCRIKPIENFRKHHRTKDGYEHICKKCRKQYGVVIDPKKIEKFRQKINDEAYMKNAIEDVAEKIAGIITHAL